MLHRLKQHFDALVKVTPYRSDAEIVAEIHETFYTEVDRLLEQAKVSKSVETQNQELLDKSARLKSLGFTSTREVQSVAREERQINDIKLENQQKEVLIEAINYYSAKYPLYKFITEESVKRICSKYNLIYGSVSKYIGTVPEKNLKQIENFKIEDSDKAHVKAMEIRWPTLGALSVSLDEIIINNSSIRQQLYRLNSNIDKLETNFLPLEIAAPTSDFDTRGLEVVDGKLQTIKVPDPIVLQPVGYKGKKYYLIVTAWGPEASDSEVVNSKMN